MHDRYDENVVWLDRIEDGVGEDFRQATPNAILDNATRLGSGSETGNGRFDRADEALAESGVLLLEILGGGKEFCRGLRVKFDPHRAMACRTFANVSSAGTVSTSPRRTSSTRCFASRIQSCRI